MKQVIDNAIKYVYEFFKNIDGSHDYYHTIRVYKIAKQIADIEKANVEIVLLAALLHDVDDYKISPSTYSSLKNAKDFLKANHVENDMIEQICKIISEVSFKGIDTKIPETLEGKIVQDADRLDAIGAIGIARALTYGGNKNRILYDPNILPNLNMTGEEYQNHISTTINHFYEKLFKLKNMMNTKTAIEIADSRDLFMHEFIERFKDEWDGII